MKLECVKEKLSNYVSLADKITSKNTTLPILGFILLSAHNNVLKIRSTNLDVGVEFKIPAKIEKEGIIAVPGSVLNNTLSCLPEGKKIFLNFKNDNLEISTENNIIVIKSQNAEDFPTLPNIQKKETIFISAQKLIKGIKSVCYSSSFSDIKPEISSVFIYPEKETLIFTATDSFRLAEKKIIYNKIKNNFSGVIIPFKNISDILRVFDGIEGEIEIVFNDNQISFYYNEIYLTSRIINGVFPDYKQIIPKDRTTEIILLKQDFIDSLKLINIFSDKFNKVTLSLNTQKNIFKINSKNDFGENTTIIKSSVSGDDIDLSFNYKYIMDCFQSIDNDSLSLEFYGENKPMVIKGIGDNSFFYLIMPINK